jgi:hypothetical protein
VALAMKLDPEFAGRLKELFIMGGNIGKDIIKIVYCKILMNNRKNKS